MVKAVPGKSSNQKSSPFFVVGWLHGDEYHGIESEKKTLKKQINPSNIWRCSCILASWELALRDPVTNCVDVDVEVVKVRRINFA